MHSTSNLEDGYMGSGKRLRYSIRKHGVENHVKEILQFFDSRELLGEAEKSAITLDMLNDTMCLNIMSGGTGGFISVEQQAYRSSCAGKAFSNKLKNNLEFAKEHGKRASLNMIKNHKAGKIKIPKFTGKKHSVETKLKMSEAKRGRYSAEANSQYGTCWITKDGMCKKIKLTEINHYMDSGWSKGRK